MPLGKGPCSEYFPVNTFVISPKQLVAPGPSPAAHAWEEEFLESHILYVGYVGKY
ncbi:hypothetical protein COO91_02076 [Nostoc flagelliforme CCNUN1]|uniref:Uncharacterized protein n=1 Tax=Nostoc flagelliforme CCNUN1 TaxID=2038116 RepID=A0A2K8SMW4_9NOSO|nr:hypothetical protein COO91_02076 [Nostoc flagelliforme CCNUN1]